MASIGKRLIVIITFKHMCMNVFPDCMSFFSLHSCLVPMKAWRGSCISWDWSNRWLETFMWVLEIKPGSTWRTDRRTVLSIAEPSLWPIIVIFLSGYIFLWWGWRVNSNHIEYENNIGMQQVVSFWVFRHSSQLKGWSSGTGFLIISLLI